MKTKDAPRTDGTAITCGFCGRRFQEDRGQPVCQSCPLAHSCRFIRCPECGYENPVQPGWLGRIGDWMSDHVSS